ncbi:hypothetical protein BHM03_00024288 [Ensete ventricosum]|uniref:Uncharacterized protein n=1 Tax=Ensete ventricosum TaxID=4639 RepID=A0A445MGN8_ENSVE|nr:hypothetical protein BHM03_00024288 [Ensete ventricosum]
MGAGGRRRRMLSGKRGRGKILAAGAGREAKDDTGRDATKWGKRDGNTPVHAGAGAATKGGRRWRLRRRRMRMRREKDTEEEPTGGRRRRLVRARGGGRGEDWLIWFNRNRISRSELDPGSTKGRLESDGSAQH